MIAFQPAAQRRVLSPLVAAQMKQMMEAVVLRGTGRKAILEGYTSAGKSGTAQKIDPATGTYSRTKYIASFAGFAPVNNPALTIAVILDSPVGPHHGGEVAGPVFARIAQPALEYLHAPHDIELPASRQLLLAARKVKDEDLEESSPDHLGDTLEAIDNGPLEPAPAIAPAKPTPSIVAATVVPAGLKEPLPRQSPPSAIATDTVENSAPAEQKPSGTVVLDVEQGGIAVPSFIGKSVRSALEAAQDAGLELDAIGSGVAHDQTPAPGVHLAAGSHVLVHFQR
jgi:cell division protein FtsI (penicillin-binding protein 3)